MNCPYCNRRIPGWTGLQELVAFHKHLRRCRKNPHRVVITDDGHGRLKVYVKPDPTLRDALRIRHESGQ